MPTGTIEATWTHRVSRIISSKHTYTAASAIPAVAYTGSCSDDSVENVRFLRPKETPSNFSGEGSSGWLLSSSSGADELWDEEEYVAGAVVA